MVAVVSSDVLAVEANPHLSELLARVEKGEQITLTRNGQPVARLLPPSTNSSPRMSAELAAFLAKTKHITLGPDLTLEELIAEARPR